MLDTVLSQDVVVPSSGFSLFFLSVAWKQIYCPAVRNAEPLLSMIIYTIFNWFFLLFVFLHIVSHAFLQRETRGPPQPLRQRAPPAKMPREAEARPKLSQRPKGGGRAEEWEVERRQVKVERHGERKGRVHIGCPNWTRGHLRSLPACLELQRPKCTPFSLDQIVTWGAEQSTSDKLRCCSFASYSC